MPDDPLVLLVRAWQEAWHVHKGDDGDVEGVTEADEPAEAAAAAAAGSVCWCVPGRKPGTSTKVAIGTLKEPQKRMNQKKQSDKAV
jgi:hypothetical protein